MTATDGNHGRAVARMAAHFGVQADRVRAGGDASRRPPPGSAGRARRWCGWTATTTPRSPRGRRSPTRGPAGPWFRTPPGPGYEQVPAWIVEGYQTLLEEVDAQLDRPPDLVAVPVGVGSLAEAVVAALPTPRRAHPGVLSVEPDTAACVLASLSADRPTTVATGATVMAGLNCGTVSSSAWPVLRDGLRRRRGRHRR